MTAVVARGETKKVENLGGEEKDEADFGGVVEGEDEVGDAGREHGSEEEIIFWEGSGGVDEAEDDAADAKEGEKVAVRGEKTEDDVDEEESDPDDKPEDFWPRMATIRSRN